MPIPLLKYAIDKDVVAFTTTREGGVSEGNYGRFNLNPYCGDSPAHVKENKDRLCAQLNIEEERLILPHQVHNDASLIIDEHFLPNNALRLWRVSMHLLLGSAIRASASLRLIVCRFCSLIRSSALQQLFTPVGEAR